MNVAFLAGKELQARLARRLQHCDFRLASILKQFNLRFLPTTAKSGFYRRLATYGHVGRLDLTLPWEATDKASLLRELRRPAYQDGAERNQ